MPLLGRGVQAVDLGEGSGVLVALELQFGELGHQF